MLEPRGFLGWRRVGGNVFGRIERGRGNVRNVCEKRLEGRGITVNIVVLENIGVSVC